MKKFGTPIGAAPGVDSEKVGLSSVGVPSRLRPGFDGSGVVRRTSRSFFLTLRLRVSVLAPGRFCLPFSGAAGSVVWPPPSSPPPVTGVSGVAGVSGVPGLSGEGVGTGRFGTCGVAVGSGTCGSCGVGTAVGTWTGPRSSIVWVGAGSGGICAAVAVAPSGTSTCSVMTCPSTSVTRTLCSCADAVLTSTVA